MALSHAVLACLLMGPATENELVHRYDLAFSYFWFATHQQVALELKHLQDQGYVQFATASQTMAQQYVLTLEGKQELAQWIAQPSETGVYHEDVLVKVCSGVLVPLPVLVQELHRCRAEHAARLTFFRSLQNRLFPMLEQLTYEERLRYLPLMRGIMMEMGWVTWCDSAIQSLQEASSPSL